MAEFEWWDTTKLNEAFNMDGACCMMVDTTPTQSNWSRVGMVAWNKGDTYPNRRVKGKLIKDGVVYEVDGLMEFGKEHGVNYTHIGNVLKGKRKSHKGFRKYGEGN